MRKRFWIFLCAWILSATAVAAIQPNSVESVRIRVRLAEALPSVSIRGLDLKIRSMALKDPSAKNIASPAIVSQGRSWEFRCQRDRIRAVELGGNQTFDLPSPVSITTPAGFLQFQGKPFREELRVYALGSLCEVLNVLDMEKYLDGLVNAEFSSKWNAEAVAAQVVAARSYAYHQMQQSKNFHFDVDATVSDQVYDGSIREDSRASRLVARTRGWVLMVQKQKDTAPLKAFYHSTCAGKTELPEQVWGVSYPGFRQAVSCPFCAASPVLRWELKLPTQMIAEKFKNGALAEPQVAQAQGWPKDWIRVLRQGELRGLRVERLDAQNRVAELNTDWFLQGSSKQLKVSGARFREWLGSGKLRSASFEVSPVSPSHTLMAPEKWHFSGRGYGHGVGMCQYGAKTMGERGYPMASILKHYYPAAVLRKLW